MSYADCIMQNPALSDKKRQELVNEYNTLVKRYTKSMGDVQAAHAAAKKFVELKEKEIIKRMDNAVRDVLAAKDLKAALDKSAAQFKAEKAKSNRFFRFLWGNEYGMAVRQKLEDINTAQMALEETAYRALNQQLEKYRTKGAGLIQDVDGFTRVVDELLGKDTGDAAARADAQAIRDVFDMLHKQYEDNGGILGKLKNYFPQRHNVKRVRNAGVEEWKNFIRPLLDMDKMIDPDTGLPFTPERLEAALDDVYGKISTNGLIEVAERAEEGLQTFTGKPSGVALRHSSSRFLHFKGADEFRAYNNTYGNGDADLFDMMIGHITSMSRDVALMQRLGPNPDGQLNRMKLLMQANNVGQDGLETAQGMFDIMAGRNAYSGAEPESHRYVRDIQNWLRSAYLGGAPISAMSDTFYVAATAKYNGLPATGALKEYIKYLNPADSADRALARRNVFVTTAVSGSSLRGARFADDMGGAHRWSEFMANFTHRASGLGIMTDSARQAVVMQTHGFMADAAMRGVKWNELPDAMRDAFARWDMTEQDYQNIIKSKPYVEPEFEADFIRPEDVAKSGYADTAQKYNMWLTDMSQSSSNEPRLLTRYISTGGQKGGSTKRLIVSSAMMFKSFGLTVMLNHTLPALRHAGQGRLGRITALAFGLTPLAAMSIQSRNVMYGKTPQDMDSPSFWMAAMLQGGGFGLFGDFMFADYSRFNKSLAETMLGPIPNLGTDIARATIGNLYRAMDENKETKFWKDMSSVAVKNIPMAKLWYTRLILERSMLDQLERAADPSYDSRIRRIENEMRRSRGQKFWWRPGQGVTD